MLVCTSPRSGSNHLAGLMVSAGLGHPLEWFGGRRLLELPDYPRDPRAQLLRALTQGRSSTGVYAIKLFASQFAQLADKITHLTNSQRIIASRSFDSMLLGL
ncbi:Stf0 sulfotransferase family protein [Mesorhizobium sp. CA7]|nr:Stf0 sulfotransferase family protein [Mesorhizobium sp. CA7]